MNEDNKKDALENKIDYLNKCIYIAIEALEHYECSHYDIENFECAHDDTATLALKKIRVIKWLNGVKNGAT